jgi:hypothetical protein
VTVGVESIVEAREKLHGSKEWWKPEYAKWTVEEHMTNMSYHKKQKTSKAEEIALVDDEDGVSGSEGEWSDQSEEEEKGR